MIKCFFFNKNSSINFDFIFTIVTFYYFEKKNDLEIKIKSEKARENFFFKLFLKLDIFFIFIVKYYCHFSVLNVMIIYLFIYSYIFPCY